MGPRRGSRTAPGPPALGTLCCRTLVAASRYSLAPALAGGGVGGGGVPEVRTQKSESRRRCRYSATDPCRLSSVLCSPLTLALSPTFVGEREYPIRSFVFPLTPDSAPHTLALATRL